MDSFNCRICGRLSQPPRMFWLLLIGAVLGVLLMLVPLARARREADRLEQENQKLAQDRQRLFDFIHLMT